MNRRVIFLIETEDVKDTQQLLKCLTGIQGLDEVTNGGLPRGRTSLICGSAGCGKTLLAMQFLVNGARHYGEPGVFMSFEENEQELAENVVSLGIDLSGLIADKKLVLDYVYFDKSEIVVTGEYDQSSINVRLHPLSRRYQGSLQPNYFVCFGQVLQSGVSP